jgi:PadR family transcriptional regulator PadR
MSEAKRTNPDFLNGVPELLILKLLARKPMYGYELVHHIKHESNAVLEFGEGCIYPILHRLERARLLASRRASVGGRWRVVYRPTQAGLRKLEDRASSWQQISEAVDRILRGGIDVEPSSP